MMVNKGWWEFQEVAVMVGEGVWHYRVVEVVVI